MSKISLDNLSDSLKEHLNTLGLTEEQVQSLINNELVDIQKYKLTEDNGYTMQADDCNNLSPNVRYYAYGGSTLNAPHAGFNGYVETYTHGPGWGSQIAHDCFNTRKNYGRELLNSSWTEWRSL